MGFFNALKLKDEAKNLLIKKALKEEKSYLLSGRESNYYIDCKAVFLTAGGLYALAVLLFLLIKAKYPEARAVGGPDEGAISLSAAVIFLSRSGELSSG